MAVALSALYLRSGLLELANGGFTVSHEARSRSNSLARMGAVPEGRAG